MKKHFLVSILLAGLVWLVPAAPAHGSVSVRLSFFHETLAPHGQWVVTASYGEVWAPAVAAGWAPYVNGEWVYTDWGWTWVSYDPWGEIPFHYGTWTWVDPQGWVWVPGRVWAPAWVTWAVTNDYVGWAPVPPSFVLSRSGYSGRPVVVLPTRYVFVPARQFVGTRVWTARIPVRQNTAILHRATALTLYAVSDGIVRNVGPTPQRLERAVGRRIEPVAIARVKVKPVALAESGVASASTLAVVAPERERSKATREREAMHRGASVNAERKTKLSKQSAVARDRGRSARPAAPQQAKSLRGREAQSVDRVEKPPSAKDARRVESKNPSAKAAKRVAPKNKQKAEERVAVKPNSEPPSGRPHTEKPKSSPRPTARGPERLKSDREAKGKSKPATTNEGGLS